MLPICADSLVVHDAGIEFGCSHVLKAFGCGVTERIPIMTELDLWAVTGISVTEK